MLHLSYNDLPVEQYEERREIYLQNLNHPESNYWNNHKICKLSQTYIADICKRRPNSNSAKLVERVLYKPVSENFANKKFFNDHKEEALSLLAEQQNIEYRECGVETDLEYPFLSATAHGLYDIDDGITGIIVLNIRQSTYGMDPDVAIRQKKLSIWRESAGGVVQVNRNDAQFYKIQGQLHIMNKNHCLYAAYTGCGHPLKVEKIYRDDDFWRDNMKDKLVDFYRLCVLPEVIDSRKARKMHLRDTTY